MSGSWGLLAHERAYWSPDGAAAGGIDFYRGRYQLPIVKGLLPAARRPFMSTGLGMDWYAAMGNHDGEIQGNYPVDPTTMESAFASMRDISGFATDDKKAYDSWATSGEVTFSSGAGPSEINMFVQQLQFRPVTPDARRKVLGRGDFAKEHFTTKGTPVGHGFVQTGSGYRTYTIESRRTRRSSTSLSTPCATTAEPTAAFRRISTTGWRAG